MMSRAVLMLNSASLRIWLALILGLCHAPAWGNDGPFFYETSAFFVLREIKPNDNFSYDHLTPVEKANVYRIWSYEKQLRQQYNQPDTDTPPEEIKIIESWSVFDPK